MGCCSTRNKEKPLYGLQGEDFQDSDLSKSKKGKSGAGQAKSKRRDDSLKITYKNADMNYVSSDEREEITYIKKIYSSIKQAKNKEGEDTLRSSSKWNQESQPQTIFKISNYNICSCRQSLKTRPSENCLSNSNYVNSKDENNNSISAFNNECNYNEKSNKLNLELSSISKVTYNNNSKNQWKVSTELEDAHRCKSTRVQRKKSSLFEKFPAHSLCHRLYNNQNQGGSFFSASLNEKYLSICSNTIISNNECSHTLIGRSGEEEKSRNQQVLRGIFTSEVFKAICFEFENVIVWGINEFKTKFRELKLILVIEINNSKETQEKIPLINRSGDNITFVPLLKKFSNKQPCRIIKYFPSKPLHNLTNQSEDSSVFENFTSKNQSISEKVEDYNKLSLQLCTYDSKSSKLVVISSDEEYFKIANQNQFQKIKFHKNLYMTNSEKKAAHLLYSIAYCVEAIPQSEELFKKENIECRLSHLTSQIVPPDNPISRFVFNKSKNTHLKQSKIKINKSFSVQDLENIEIPTAVKSCGSIWELLDILDKVSYKYDLVEILTFIEKYITSSDMHEDCIKGYRQRLCQLLGELKPFLRKDDTFFSFFMSHLKFAFFISKRAKKRWSTSKRGSDNNESLTRKLNNSIGRSMKTSTKIEGYDSVESLSLEEKSLSICSTSNILSDQPEMIYLYEALFTHLIDILKHKPKPLHVQLITEFINKSVKSIENDFTKLSLLLTNLEVFLTLMLKFSQYEECVAPLTSILSYICLMFKKQNKDRIFLESPEHKPTNLGELSEEKYTKCLSTILEEYPYNSMIVINVLRISRYLFEKQLFFYSSIFSFETLREIFCSHTLCNFDDLHICILGTIKGVFNTTGSILTYVSKELIALVGLFSFTFILAKNKIISSLKEDSTKLKYQAITIFKNLAFSIDLIIKLKDMPEIKESIDKELLLKNLIDLIFFGLLESNFIASYETIFSESDINTQISLFKFYNSVLELLLTKSLVQVSLIIVFYIFLSSINIRLSAYSFLSNKLKDLTIFSTLSIR